LVAFLGLWNITWYPHRDWRYDMRGTS